MARIQLLKYDTNGNIEYTYTLGNFARISYDLNSPVTPAPLPEESAQQNVLVKIEGNSSNIRLGWTIRDFEESQVEAAFGVPDIEVRTIAQHLNFFRQQFVPISIEDSYGLIIDYNDPGENDGNKRIAFSGSITKISFSTGSDRPVSINASVDFLEGTVIAIYDLDVPSLPINVTSTVFSDTQNGPRNRIRLEWEPPNEEDNDVATTGYKIVAARVSPTPGSPFEPFGSPTAPTARSFEFSPLADGAYRIQLIPLSSNGEGRTYTEGVTIDTS